MERIRPGLTEGDIKVVIDEVFAAQGGRRERDRERGRGRSQGGARQKAGADPAGAVQELVDGWLAAQNEGDFSAYAALYGDGFGGVRRSGKKVVRLDRGAW